MSINGEVFLGKESLQTLRYKVVRWQSIVRRSIATKTVATRRFVSSDPDAMSRVAQVVKCQVAIRSLIARNLARKSAFPLSRPPTTTLVQELGSTLRGANMNHRDDQALDQAGENKEALNNVLEQASDLGRQNISLLWHYSIFNEPIKDG